MCYVPSRIAWFRLLIGGLDEAAGFHCAARWGRLSFGRLAHARSLDQKIRRKGKKRCRRRHFRDVRWSQIIPVIASLLTCVSLAGFGAQAADAQSDPAT